MNKRDLNHTCSRRHSLSCCAKSPDTILSPGIILLWGLMVANCPIYQHKTVLCNLASLLLCIHQYIRSKKSPTESKPGRQCDLELTEGWSNGAAHWHAGDQDLACAASFCTARWAERHDRSSWTCCTDKSPLTLANLSIAQTWHWWLYTCIPFICIIPNAMGLQLDTGSCGLQSPTIHGKSACPTLPAGPVAGRSSGWPQAVPTWSSSQAEPWAEAAPAAAPGAGGNKKWWWVSCAFLCPRVMARLYLDSHGCV